MKWNGDTEDDKQILDQKLKREAELAREAKQREEEEKFSIIKKIATGVATEVAEDFIKTLIPRLLKENKIELVLPKEEDS